MTDRFGLQDLPARLQAARRGAAAPLAVQMPRRKTATGLARKASTWVTAGLLALAAALPAWTPAHAQRAPQPFALPPTDSAPSAPSATPWPAMPPAERADTSRFAESVVRVDSIIVEDGRTVEALGDRRSGSGVILDERTILTIGYLVMEADKVMVTTASGRHVPASLLAYDHASGFGLLRTALELPGPALALGDSDRIGERQRVLTIGHGEPQATPLIVVSRKPFTGNWEYLVERALFTFPPVNNWSGSALIDGEGKLVGIGSVVVGDAAVDAQGVPGNMFVPVNLLKPILSELMSNGRVSRAQPWLGMTTEVVRGNLMVTRVSPGGPAEQAGVGAGDIVLGVGPDKVADQAEFYRQVWKAGPAGTEIAVRLLKSGDVRDLRIRSIDRNEFLRKPSGV